MTKVHQYTLKGKAEFKDNVCIISTITHVELFFQQGHSNKAPQFKKKKQEKRSPL